MHKYTRYSILFVFVLALLASSCKKETTPEVYFTTSSATGEAGGSPSTVTIEFSKPTEEIVEIDFESVGADPIRFGSYHQAFLLDDSEKCQVTIDNQAFIDTMGHIKVTMGVKKLTVTFTPQFDNFPHAAASYSIKMAKAKGANIRQGSDVFTYTIGSTPATTLFNSTLFYFGQELTRRQSGNPASDTTMEQTGIFELQSHEYGKNAQGTYDLKLYYSFVGGTTHVRTLNFLYTLPALPEGDSVLTCSNSSLVVEIGAVDINGLGAFTKTLDCASPLFGYGAALSVSKGFSPVYRDYVTFTGNVNVQDNTNNYRFNGSLSSQFLLFD